MSRAVLTGAVVFLALAPVGRATDFGIVANDTWCREVKPQRDAATWCEVREATFPAPARALAVDARPNGAIKVRGGDRADLLVRVRVVASAASQAEAQALAAQVKVSGPPTVQAAGPGGESDRRWSASFELATPRHVDLRLDALNGPLAITDVEGELWLATQNGPLEVRRAGGRVHGRTANGPLSVELGGSAWNGAGLDLATTNGPLTLSLPVDYNAELDAATLNGPVHIAMALAGRHDGRVVTRLGRGGAPLRLRTRNGPLTVERP